MSGTASTYVPKSRVAKWFEARLPIAGLVHSSFIAYPVPRNLNYFWTFGAILAAFLGIQIVTGIWLAMHYEPSATGAFTSVEKIMRDVNYGWLLRYAHANGASMFLAVVSSTSAAASITGRTRRRARCSTSSASSSTS